MLFPGNPDPLSLTLGGPVAPLVCGFIRRDNLLALRKMFTNLYKLRDAAKDGAKDGAKGRPLEK